MKQTNSRLWGSISILIGAVIAILALVRGIWQVPLLIGVFTIWGLFLIMALLVPALRSVHELRRREKRTIREKQTLAEANLLDMDMAQKLLHNVNFRISDYLRSAYPQARWEWTLDTPAVFAAQGGTARIRVYGIPDYEFADVTLDQKANLTCALVKVVPIHGQAANGAEQALPPNQQPVDPQVWYELQGRKVLEDLVTDLNSRGHKKLLLKEDGAICIQPTDGGEEAVQENFRSFPEKVYWSRLAEVLDQAGLSATVLDNCIQVSW